MYLLRTIITTLVLSIYNWQVFVYEQLLFSARNSFKNNIENLKYQKYKKLSLKFYRYLARYGIAECSA